MRVNCFPVEIHDFVFWFLHAFPLSWLSVDQVNDSLSQIMTVGGSTLNLIWPLVTVIHVTVFVCFWLKQYVQNGSQPLSQSSLFNAFHTACLLTLMPNPLDKLNWYYTNTFFYKSLGWICTNLISGGEREKIRKGKKGLCQISFLYSNLFYFSVGWLWVLILSHWPLCVDGSLCTWEAHCTGNNCLFHSKKGPYQLRVNTLFSWYSTAQWWTVDCMCHCYQP